MGLDKGAELIQETGVIAIVRMDSPEQLIDVARAIAEGGVRVIEFPMTTPKAIKVIEEATAVFRDDILLGAGSVLDSETARAVILAGARFIVTPTLSPAVIETCRRYSITVIPGAFTATEALTAWELGADFVKVFPAGIVGPAYINALHGPLPQIKFVAVGNISIDTAGEYITAGASAVGIGGQLIDKKAVKEGRWDVLSDAASRLMESINRARS